jgi:gamma-glutamylaminecyclotransferase
MYIFVYGTLKQGFHNHHLVEDAEFICEATTKEKYPMVNTEKYFPYLLNEKGVGHHIKGEVYRINTATLAMLDILEGYPDLYTRETIIVLSKGIELTTLVYFLNGMLDYSSLELLNNFTEN